MRSIVDLVNLDPVDNSGVLRLLRRFPPALVFLSVVCDRFCDSATTSRVAYQAPEGRRRGHRSRSSLGAKRLAPHPADHAPLDAQDRAVALVDLRRNLCRVWNFHLPQLPQCLEGLPR